MASFSQICWGCGDHMCPLWYQDWERGEAAGVVQLWKPRQDAEEATFSPLYVWWCTQLHIVSPWVDKKIYSAPPTICVVSQLLLLSHSAVWERGRMRRGKKLSHSRKCVSAFFPFLFVTAVSHSPCVWVRVILNSIEGTNGRTGESQSQKLCHAVIPPMLWQICLPAHFHIFRFVDLWPGAHFFQDTHTHMWLEMPLKICTYIHDDDTEF